MTIVNGQIQIPHGVIPQKDESYGEFGWHSPSVLSQCDSPPLPSRHSISASRTINDLSGNFFEFSQKIYC